MDNGGHIGSAFYHSHVCMPILMMFHAKFDYNQMFIEPENVGKMATSLGAAVSNSNFDLEEL